MGSKWVHGKRLSPFNTSVAEQRHILFELIVTKKSQSCNRVINTFHPICPLDTCDVRSRRGAMSAIIRSALRPGRCRRARSSGGPLRLVLRVVRVDASAARAALGSGSEDRASAPHGRMLSAGWARWVRVGLAPCSNTSDVGWAAILAILTCHRLSTPPEWEVWCVPLSSHPRMCR